MSEIGIRWLENGTFKGAWHAPLSGAQALIYEAELRRLQGGDAEALETAKQPAWPQSVKTEQEQEVRLSDLQSGRDTETVRVSELPIPPPNSEVVAQPRANLEHRIGSGFRANDPVQAIDRSSPLDSGPRDLNQYHKNVVDLMTREVTALSPDTTTEEALEILDQSNFHHAPVVDAQGRLLGLVSDRDLLGREGILADRMITRVLTASPQTGLQEAAEALVQERFHCLVVVNEERRIEGIITGFDLLRYLVKHPAMQLWQSSLEGS